MLRILVTGSRGRMGQAIIACSEACPELTISAGIDLGDSLTEALPDCDTVIDFTYHGFTPEIVSGCLAAGKSLVLGTTGHTDEELAQIREASRHIPIVHAPNYSVGVNTLFWLTRRATEILGPDFDLEVVEMHHHHKKDSPSGTARRLAEILAETRDLSYDKDVRHGRFGDVGARTRTEIGMHALRGGDVVGDHTVIYACDGERIELTHKASSRNTFANGSLRAALWLHQQGHRSGLFDMQDVLGLK